MAINKLPWLKFYPADWLMDGISGCSLAAQGLWLKMLFIMHDCGRYGYLERDGVSIPAEHIARICGISLEEYTSLLSELDSVGVPARTSSGTIYSRRLVRDDAKRAYMRKVQRLHRSRVRDMSTACHANVKGRGQRLRGQSKPKNKNTDGGVDEPLFFTGEILKITAEDERRLAEWFPRLDRILEYHNADAWCIARGRRPKSHRFFMRRWLLKTGAIQDEARREARVGLGPQVGGA